MREVLQKRLVAFHRDEGGQIIFLVLFSLFALVCLIALVVNTGDQITHKMEMQNAADAVAVSGANWVARGMNVISMNNVAMTDILAVIVIAKSLSQTAKIALPIANAQIAVAEGMMASALPPVQVAGGILYV